MPSLQLIFQVSHLYRSYKPRAMPAIKRFAGVWPTPGFNCFWNLHLRMYPAKAGTFFNGLDPVFAGMTNF